MIKPAPKDRDGEKYGKELNENTFLLVCRKNKVHGMLLEDGKLIRVSADDEHGNLKGMICIAKVIDVVKNIDAMFVRLPDKSKCFVSMTDCRKETNLSGDRMPVQGDNVLLQVTKDAAKGKEASGTMALKLTGEYCIATIGRGEVLFSHKISHDKKMELENVFSELKDKVPNNINIILRTSVADISDPKACLTECEALVSELSILIEKSKSRTEYSVLRKPLKQYQEILRSLSDKTSLRLMAEDETLFNELIVFVKEYMPDFLSNCIRYSDKMVSLSTLFGVEKKLSEAISTKVWLENGAFIYIEPTQAMTVIDVNSGKYDRNLTSDETYYQINLAAAQEIARQIVLRNLSGIIIIDFISMKNKENNKKLLENLSEFLKNDTNSARIIDITKLGLVEITRKKTSKTLYEQILM